MNTTSPKETIMVCVTRQATCERLIRAGALRAEKTGAHLIVAHALYPYECIMDNNDEAAALELLFEKANEYDAEMVLFRCEDKLRGLADCAKKRNVNWMILGASQQAADSVIAILRDLLPEVNFMVLEASELQGHLA